MEDFTRHFQKLWQRSDTAEQALTEEKKFRLRRQKKKKKKSREQTRQDD